MVEIKEVRYRTEKVLEQGKWNYWGNLVTLSLGVSLGCSWGNYACLTLMLDDLVLNVGGDASSIPTIMGFFNFANSFSALFAGTLNKMISMRSTAIIGAVLLVTGNILSVFATSVNHLIVSYGIIFGTGIGLWIPTAFATFNNYFVRERVLMMSIAQSINGCVMMIYPLIVQYSINTYGCHGALAIIAAINSHVIVGMLIMQPVEWHYKVNKVPIDEESQQFVKIIENELHLTEMCDDFNDNEENVEMKTRTHVINEISHEDRLNMLSKTNEIIAIPRRISVQLTKIGIWKKIVDFLDLTLLKDVVYVNIVFGLTCTHISDQYFYVLMPKYLEELNISKDDGAWILSLIAGFDLSSRIAWSIVSFVCTFKARYTYTVGSLLCIISRIVFLNVFDFQMVTIAAAVMGFLRTFVHVPTPLVIAEHLPKERFVSGYGLYMFLQGLSIFLVSPLIGWIRYVTPSYVICFYILTFLMSLCTIPWVIEFAWFWIYPRKPIRINNKLNQ